ncbi:MAG: nuclear transport factor 2 family protein [Caulobacterales bacterium]
MDTSAFAETMLQAIVNDMEFFLANSQPDVVLEFPFAASVGMVALVEGKDKARKFLETLPSVLPDVVLKNVRVTPFADPNAVLLEYDSDCPKAKNYKNQYITIMKFRDGKLTLFKEHFDTVEAKRALGGG